MKVMLAVLSSIAIQYALLAVWMALRILSADLKKAGRSNTENKVSDTPRIHPSLTILIPVKNDRDALSALLEQLSDAPAEILVINDHSSDGSAEMAIERGIQVISNTAKGKRAALLTGLSHASGDITLTLDSDVKLPEKWLEQTLKALKQTSTDLWIFPVFVDPNHNLLSRFEALDALSLTATTAAFAYQKRAIMGSGAFMAARTDLLREAFICINDQLPSGDDTFVVQHMRAEKRAIRFVPSASVSVKPQSSLKNLLRQRVRWGYKSPHYTDKVAIGVAWLVFLTNFFWLVALAFALLGVPAFWTLVALKPLSDALVLVPAMRHFKQWRLAPILPFALVVYPFYLVAVASWAIFVNPDLIQKQWR